MATSSNIICGVCDSQDITRPAAHWCPECDEGLCSECYKHHNNSKATRSHEVISVEHYRKIPPSISSISQFCQEHDRKYVNYCQIHEALCCPVCIAANHSGCKRILAIDELLKTAKTSPLLDSLVETLQDVKVNIDKAIGDRKQNLTKIEIQKKTIRDQIKHMRDKLNSHLDDLEQTILKDLIHKEDTLKSNITKLLTNLNERGRKVDQLRNTVFAVQQYASDIQTFFGGRSLEQEVSQEDKYIQSLTDDGSLQQHQLTCTINDKLSGVLSAVTTFGSITVETSPSSFVMRTEKQKQAQILTHVVPTRPKSIDDICLSLEKTFEITGKTRDTDIKGCTVLSNGKIVFSDNSGRLVVFREHVKFDYRKDMLPFRPCDITTISSNLVAVSGRFKIVIVDIERQKTVDTIQTSTPCIGIVLHQNCLLFYQCDRGIQKINLVDKTKSCLIEQNQLPGDNNGDHYLTTSGDRLYITHFLSIVVSCFTMNGEKLWQFQDWTLKYSSGITADDEGNIYVASYGSNSIIVISPDGKKGRQLLDEKDGLSRPHVACFDRQKNRLIVSNNNGTAFLYRLS